VWRITKLSERVELIERRRISDEDRVYQLEKKLVIYVYDVYDKVFGGRPPTLGWWLIQAPVVMLPEGKEIHLMDILGYGSHHEAKEYAAALGKKHGGQFKPTQLTLEQYRKLQDEQGHLLNANGGNYYYARPFLHRHTSDLLSGLLSEECVNAPDHEEDEKAKCLWSQLDDLRLKVRQLRI